MKNKILVVDDEQFVQDFWKKVFIKEGFFVRTCSNAEEALDIIEKDDFDVFFFDIALPAMDGLELFKRIKPDSPTSVFFAMTGYSLNYDLEKCRAVGFDDYFSKPYELELILEATEEALKKVKRWREG